MTNKKVEKVEKAKKKAMNFNISLPWDISIANQLGVPQKELTENIKADQRLHDTVSSTCAMIRDFSVRQIYKHNKQLVSTLRDICQGDGYSLLDGKYIQTGGCQKGFIQTDKPHQPRISDHREQVDFKGQCIKKEGEIYINFPNKSNPNANIGEQRQNDKDHLASISRNKSIVSAAEANAGAGNAASISFLQTKGIFSDASQNSNQEIPGQNSSNLNGKGYTFNKLPFERQDDSSNPVLQKGQAQDSNRQSQRVGSMLGNPMNLLKNVFAEEQKAIGAEPGSKLNTNDSSMQYKKLDIPDQICTVICAGLNLESVITGEENIEYPSYDVNKNKSVNEDFIANSTAGIPSNGGKGPNDMQECENLLPYWSDCITKGKDISAWFVERFLNPEHVCNWDQGTCGSIFNS